MRMATAWLSKVYSHLRRESTQMNPTEAKPAYVNAGVRACNVGIALCTALLDGDHEEAKLRMEEMAAPLEAFLAETKADEARGLRLISNKNVHLAREVVMPGRRNPGVMALDVSMTTKGEGFYSRAMRTIPTVKGSFETAKESIIKEMRVAVLEVLKASGLKISDAREDSYEQDFYNRLRDTQERALSEMSDFIPNKEALDRVDDGDFERINGFTRDEEIYWRNKMDYDRFNELKFSEFLFKIEGFSGALKLLVCNDGYIKITMDRTKSESELHKTIKLVDQIAEKLNGSGYGDSAVMIPR